MQRRRFDPCPEGPREYSYRPRGYGYPSEEATHSAPSSRPPQLAASFYLPPPPARPKSNSDSCCGFFLDTRANFSLNSSIIAKRAWGGQSGAERRVPTRIQDEYTSPPSKYCAARRDRNPRHRRPRTAQACAPAFARQGRAPMAHSRVSRGIQRHENRGGRASANFWHEIFHAYFTHVELPRHVLLERGRRNPPLSNWRLT